MLKTATSLPDAAAKSEASVLAQRLLGDVQQELKLSHASAPAAALKERAGFRQEQFIAQQVRSMTQGIGLLASIGAVAPFAGLFGTVWGIMNSFIGIAVSQSTNLATVAPGIAEALLATAGALACDSFNSCCTSPSSRCRAEAVSYTHLTLPTIYSV